MRVVETTAKWKEKEKCQQQAIFRKRAIKEQILTPRD